MSTDHAPRPESDTDDSDATYWIKEPTRKRPVTTFHITDDCKSLAMTDERPVSGDTVTERGLQPCRQCVPRSDSDSESDPDVSDPADTTAPEGEIPVCPECDDPGVLRRGSALADLDRRDDASWYCPNCEHNFEEPTTRPPETLTTRSGLAKDLLEADPEEVSR